MISIFYDGECPFCTRYVQMVRLQRADSVELVNLRENDTRRRELNEAGFDLDGGMVVEDGTARYGGDKAVAYIASLTTPSDGFNRLNRWLFSKPALASLLYPVLRAGRWLALFLMGRSFISQADRSNDARREIFATFFALFSVFHFFNYVIEYRLPLSLDLVALLGAALALLFKPPSSRLLFVLMLVSTISTVVQAPVASNHTIVRAAALLGYWLAFATAMFRNDPFERIFERFAPAGCAALLVMYFFGIFHKINTDFLNPETSCAPTLWALMPWPLSAFQGPVIDYAAIYGTFIVEGLIACALVIKRFRHWGIAAGIGFHLLLSLSSYAMYISFTTLSIALHTLWLNESAARKTLASPIVRAVRAKLVQPIYRVAVIGLCVWLAIFAFGGHYSLATFAVLPLVLPFCWALLFHAGEVDEGQRSVPVIGVLVGALFFANCAMPYLGLKTAQSVNMFANLRLEAGVSNHLVISSAQRPFDYLQDVVTLKKSGTHRVYYDVLAWLQRNPDQSISFTRNGVLYENANAQTLAEDIEMILLPEWVNKWFHFQPVDLKQPEVCGI
ncbi:Protein of unknown function, DUF393 [Erythrobacter litoralis]|uniref:DUF393 domain-containing protein n=1 Tax=Erythrobacter litoralis TaxID=39960 RepID=A0A074MUB3_9SPHN|nr:DCC1-like thiol-disulfide oxidoreductase family protein [Erythrobacter litoralis]AOL23928.1 Protein of unknown function, DUF393 [Erythrobacter litoralis]KEO98591.1 hypothetical protein EH32_05660 [Erythrobacter litoralis]